MFSPGAALIVITIGLLFGILSIILESFDIENDEDAYTRQKRRVDPLLGPPRDRDHHQW